MLEKEREREREIQFFESSLVCVYIGGQIHVVILDSLYTSSRHFALSIFQSNLIGMLPCLSRRRHIWSPTLSSSHHFKIQRSSQNIIIIPFQNMLIPSHSTLPG